MSATCTTTQDEGAYSDELGPGRAVVVVLWEDRYQMDLLSVLLLPLAMPQGSVLAVGFQMVGLHKCNATFSRCIVSILASVSHIGALPLHKMCRIGEESFALGIGNVVVVARLQVDVDKSLPTFSPRQEAKLRVSLVT